MDDPRTILIVGGGVGGMCAAIALARSGRSVRLIDADPDWRALGAGMTLNGGALRAFHQLGLLDEVASKGACGGAATLCRPDGVILFAAPPVSPFGPGVPGVGGIMRPVLHEILQQHTRAAGVEIGLGQRLVGLQQGSGGVTAQFADGSRATFDLLVGADGINSTVRSIVFPDAPVPAFTGQGCWRAVVSRPAEVTGPLMFFGRQKCGLNPVSKDQMYLFLLQNVKDNRWLPENEWPQLLRAELEEFTAPMLRRVSDELDTASLIVYRPLEAGLVPSPWFRGRVLMIGDAAHATTPHSAYGAALAIEDAVVLAEELDAGGGLHLALDRFMDRRFERCRAVVEGSVLQGELEQRGASMDEFNQASRAVSQVIVEPI